MKELFSSCWDYSLYGQQLLKGGATICDSIRLYRKQVLQYICSILVIQTNLFSTSTENITIFFFFSSQGIYMTLNRGFENRRSEHGGVITLQDWHTIIPIIKNRTWMNEVHFITKRYFYIIKVSFLTFDPYKVTQMGN